MGDTPRLNFPYIVSSHILDALVQPVIEGALVNNPPASPAPGVLYVVGRAPNGAWTGKAECLAQYVNDVWTFYVPFEGLTAWNKASKSRWYYSGTEWSELSDDQHSKRTDNPHKVTAEQVGAETPSGAQTKANAVQANLTAHINNGTHKWSSITDKPSKLQDYGIVDAYTKSEVDSYREEAKAQIGAEQGELGVEIKGRTLVNLLGKDGNFEVDSNGDGVADGWFAGNPSVRTLENTAKFGSKSQRIASSVSDTQQSRSVTHQVPFFANKYYVFLIDMVTDGTSQYILRTQWDSAGTSANSITQTGNKTAFMKFHPAADFNGYVAFYNWNAVGATGWIQGDGARLYEITQAEYNAIDSMTEAQVAAKYPYVDSVQFKKDVLVTQIGKQLIPPFNSGEWTLHANTVVNGAYNITHNAVASGENSALTFSNLVQLKEYTFSMTYTGTVDITCLTNGVATRNIAIGSSSSTIKFTLSGSENAVRILLKSPSAGTYTFTNPQLELASTATTFEPQVKSYAHTPMQIAQDESVWLTPTISVYKEVWKKNVVLDGSLGWLAGGSYTGYKSCYAPASIVGNIALTSATAIVVKYQGNIINKGATNSVTDGSDIYASNTTNFYLTAPNTDTGFIDSLTTTSAEWKAYFYGWRMCASDGGTYVSGTKYWKKITDGTGITSTLPTASYAGYTPNVLHYKLATPVYHINYLNNDPTKPLMSAGSVVNIPQGVTQVEQRSGIAFRSFESIITDAAYGYLNGITAPLKYRQKTYVDVYKKGISDRKNWTTMPISQPSTRGLQVFAVPIASYDSTATYTVTYEQLDKYLYTVDTLAVDNPVTTRQRNFSQDFAEQKVAYFKINPVDLVGATANLNPTTLADHGILDAYTKDVVDAIKLSTSNPLANASVYHYRDVVAYSSNSSPTTGTIKITLPSSWTNSMFDIKVKGYHHYTNSNWEVTLSGQNPASAWSNTSALLSPNCPFTSVRFAYDSAVAKCCILLGTTGMVQAYPKIVISEVVVGNANINTYGTGWSVSTVADETTIISVSGSTSVKTLAYVESGALTVTNASAGSIQSAYFYSSDYTAGNKNYIRLRQQVASNSSYSAYLGVDKDTGNTFLSNDTLATQHLSITPSGRIGIGKTAPTVPLDVAGNMRAGSVSSDSSVIATQIASDNSAVLRAQNDANRRLDLYSLGSAFSAYHSLKPNATSIYTNAELGIEVDGAYPITFWANSYERMRIAANGNVGIGTANPVSDAKLTLREDNTQVFALALQNRQNNISWYQYVDVGAVGDSSFGILNTATGSNVFCINPAGKIGISGVTDPKSNLHSTGSTILGVDRSVLNYSNIGNGQMQVSLSESDNVLWLDAKRSDGTIKQIGLALGDSKIIGPGTSLWISSEYQPVVNTVTSVAHGLTLDPVRCRCDVLLKCVVAQGNYSVGDFAMGVIVNVGGSAEFVLSPALDSTNIRVNSGSGGPYAMNKTTGAYFQVTPANWRYVFRIWY